MAVASSGCAYLSGITGGQLPLPHATLTPTMTTTIAPSSDSSSQVSVAPARATVTPTPAPTASDGTAMLTRKFVWLYKDMEWRYTANISQGIYDFYRSKPHGGTANYANYALSNEDRPFLQDMAAQFKQVGANNGYSQYDDAMIVAAFVQSLPYTDDLDTTGQAEYPRYPLETLVDNGGDCEDKSILAAAILHEMGYNVIFLKFPDHMAVGVELPEGVSLPDNKPPAVYDYRGKRYYYMETSEESWNIGDRPDELENAAVTFYTMARDPVVEMDFNTTIYGSDLDSIEYRVHCTIKNDGPGTASNIKVHMMALAPERGADQIWLPDQQFALGDYSEGQTGVADGILKIPRGQVSQIKVVVSGDNFEGSEQSTQAFDT